jgi:hypothetical protein
MLVISIIALIILGYLCYRLIKREGGIFLGPYEFKFTREPGPEEYMKRYKELQKKNQEFESRLVLSAAANRFPQNADIFKTLMEKIFTDLKVAKSEKDIEDIMTRGERALEELGRNAGSDSMALVEQYSKKLLEIREEFEQLKARHEDEIKQRQIERNREVLLELESILEGIKASDDEMGIRKAINNAASIESQIDVSLLEETLGERYQELKTAFYRVAEEKVEELRSARYGRYNRKAIDRLKNLLDRFSENEKEYSRVSSNLPILIKEHIASLNTAYFDGPTMQYFNYVYGYIFSLIDDDLKFEVTRIMTETLKDTLEL